MMNFLSMYICHTVTCIICLIIPKMVAVFPVPGGPCKTQILGIVWGYCAASAMVEIALFWSSSYAWNERMDMIDVSSIIKTIQ